MKSLNVFFSVKNCKVEVVVKKNEDCSLKMLNTFSQSLLRTYFDVVDVTLINWFISMPCLVNIEIAVWPGALVYRGRPSEDGVQ